MAGEQASSGSAAQEGSGRGMIWSCEGRGPALEKIPRGIDHPWRPRRSSTTLGQHASRSAASVVLATEGDLPNAACSLCSAVYGRRPLLVLRRSLQIGTSFGRWFALRYLNRVDDMFEAIRNYP